MFNFLGLEWGRNDDPTCIAIVSADEKLLHLERRFGIGFSVQRAFVREMYHQWEPHQMWADSSSIGSPNIEALQSEGLPVLAYSGTRDFTNRLIANLDDAIRHRDLDISKYPELGEQLSSGYWQSTPSGIYWRANPAAGRDMVMAVAMALHGVSNPRVAFRLP